MSSDPGSGSPGTTVVVGAKSLPLSTARQRRVTLAAPEHCEDDERDAARRRRATSLGFCEKAFHRALNEQERRLSISSFVLSGGSFYVKRLDDAAEEEATEEDPAADAGAKQGSATLRFSFSF